MTHETDTAASAPVRPDTPAWAGDRDAYLAELAHWWNSRQVEGDALNTDRANVALGEVDGFYHHHYGLGHVNPTLLADVQARPDDPDVQRRIVRELHRLENDQAEFLLHELGRVRPADRLLDAGCGRGGTCFLAHQRFGCSVDGVTISEDQVTFCRSQALARGVSGKVTFTLTDMCRIPSPDETYSAIWNNETTMYVDLGEWFAAVARLLKPGGRWVGITGAHHDLWSGDGSRSAAVRRINERYLCSVHSRADYLTALEMAGLVVREVKDLTEGTLPYWQLRSTSTIAASGVERDFLEAYGNNSFQYLLIVAERP